MKKGKIMLSVCTSLLCIGMLAGCNGTTDIDKLHKEEVGTGWEEVTEFLNSIYTNVSGWEAVSVEYDETDYRDTSFRVYRDEYNEETGRYDVYVTYYNGEQTTIENGTIVFTSDENGFLYGYAEDYYDQERIYTSERDPEFNAHSYHDITIERLYYDNSITYEEYWDYSINLEEEDAEPEEWEYYDWYDNEYVYYSEHIDEEVAYEITRDLNNYAFNVDKSDVLWATLGESSLSWAVREDETTYELTFSIDSRRTINYFSISTTYESYKQHTTSTVVYKEIDRKSVTTPEWFDINNYDIDEDE